MGKIRVLPDRLINQIAAGEVIERPASVVKELVENALDAAAQAVSVELESGGRRRILVEDDGSGMDEDDLLMALERHATSKIASERDLFGISTLGFRGEAVSSIASVARVTISSRTAETEEGRRIRIEGGKYREIEPCGMARGTRVEVSHLFFNVPARRKFLRAPSTELTHVITLIEHYALARPGVAFRLSHEGRSILNARPAADLEIRFFSIFPELPSAEFSRLHERAGGLRLTGLAGPPSRNVGSPRYQFTLVNGRFVRDRLVQHAIREAYADTMPKGRYAVVFVALEVPPDKVDVNVHPTKREIRFVESSRIHDFLLSRLRAAVTGSASDNPTPSGEGTSLPAPAAPGATPFSVSDGTVPFFPPERPADAARPLRQPDLPGAHPEGSPLRALCQWRSSFILCDTPTGFAIVDQHVAHERIRFEQFRCFLEQSGPRQGFLTPRTYKLPRALSHRLEETCDLLTAQGFEAEPFGEGVVAVRSAPAFLEEREVDPLLGELIETLGESGLTPRDRWKEVLVMRSCRGSVMLNDPLTREEMQYLLDTLHRLDAPLTCPHGRPIVFHLSEGDILSRFDRK